MSHRKPQPPLLSAAELFRIVTLRLADDWRADRPHRVELNAAAVHDMRINLRKARTALKLFEPILPDVFYRTADRSLRTLARRFDVARDLDVLRDEILPKLRTASGGANSRSMRSLSTRIDAAARKARTVDQKRRSRRQKTDAPLVESARLMTAIVAAGQRLRDSEAARRPGRKFLRARIEKMAARARRRLARASEDDRAALHRLRIALKQLRDTQLLSRDFLARRQRIDLAPLRRATAALGELQDYERARVLLTSLLHDDPRLAEPVTAAVWRLETFHRAAAPRALKLARRALRDA